MTQKLHAAQRIVFFTFNSDANWFSNEDDYRQHWTWAWRKRAPKKMRNRVSVPLRGFMIQDFQVLLLLLQFHQAPEHPWLMVLHLFLCESHSLQRGRFTSTPCGKKSFCIWERHTAKIRTLETLSHLCKKFQTTFFKRYLWVRIVEDLASTKHVFAHQFSAFCCCCALSQDIAKLLKAMKYIDFEGVIATIDVLLQSAQSWTIGSTTMLLQSFVIRE